MKSLYIVTSYPLDEPVVKHRLTPFIQRAREASVAVVLVSPAGEGERVCMGERFTHRLVPYSASRGSNFIRRAFSEWRLARRLLREVPSGDDVHVFLTVPSMFLLFGARAVSAVRSYLDIRDLTWEYLSERRLLTRSAKRLFRFLARRRMRQFELITVTNNTERKYLTEIMDVSVNRIIMVPNGISSRQYERLDFAPPDHRSNRPVQVSYIGNVGLAQNLSTLLEAAKRFRDMQFSIVGGGTDLPRIRDLCARMGLENVKLFGRLPWDEVIAVYAESDILYAQLGDDYAGAMPSKLYEYLSTNRYIIYGGRREAADLLARFDHNLVIPPNDPGALATAITSVSESGLYRKRSATNRDRIGASFIREDCVEPFFQKIGF